MLRYATSLSNMEAPIRLGCPKILVDLFQSFYRAARRTWTYAGHTSPPYTTRRGFFQGLPEAPVELNYLVVFLVVCDDEAFSSFADDISAQAASMPELQELANILSSWVQLLGVQFSLPKCTWGTNQDNHSAHSTLRLQGHEVQQTMGTRVLGHHIYMTSQYSRASDSMSKTLDSRIQRWGGWITRLTKLPISYNQRITLLRSLSTAAFYGIESELRLQGAIPAFSRKIMSAAFRTHSPRLCSELFFSFFTHGHMLDAQRVPIYRTASMLWRMAFTWPRLLDDWGRGAARASPTLGNFVGLLNERIGLEDSTIFEVSGLAARQQPAHPHYQDRWHMLSELARNATSTAAYYKEVKHHSRLAQSHARRGLHALRNKFRAISIQTAAVRRPREFSGLVEVDRHRTFDLLLSGRITEQACTTLRTILLGGTITMDRLYRKSYANSTRNCAFCDMNEPETELHRWLICPAWRMVRNFNEDELHLIRTAPTATSACGWIDTTCTWGQGLICKWQLTMIHIQDLVFRNMYEALSLDEAQVDDMDLASAEKHERLLALARTHGLHRGQVSRATRLLRSAKHKLNARVAHRLAEGQGQIPPGSIQLLWLPGDARAGGKSNGRTADHCGLTTGIGEWQGNCATRSQTLSSAPATMVTCTATTTCDHRQRFVTAFIDALSPTDGECDPRPDKGCKCTDKIIWNRGHTDTSSSCYLSDSRMFAAFRTTSVWPMESAPDESRTRIIAVSSDVLFFLYGPLYSPLIYNWGNLSPDRFTSQSISHSEKCYQYKLALFKPFAFDPFPCLPLLPGCRPCLSAVSILIAIPSIVLVCELARCPSSICLTRLSPITQLKLKHDLHCTFLLIFHHYEEPCYILTEDVFDRIYYALTENIFGKSLAHAESFCKSEPDCGIKEISPDHKAALYSSSQSTTITFDTLVYPTRVPPLCCLLCCASRAALRLLLPFFPSQPYC